MSAGLDGGITSGAARRPDIQGLRGLAVLLVVLFHAGLPVPGGFTGVDVFFAISGFVITAMLLKELTSVDRINMRRFYGRRVKRLGPALALMVFTITALGTIIGPVATQQVGTKTGLFASLFSANAYLFNVHTGYFDPAATLNPFLHTWTLAVEEQFYVFFPTLLLLSWWLGRRSRFLRRSGRWPAVAAVSVTTVASFLLALELSSQGAYRQQFAFYGSPTRAWEFGAGAMIALLGPWLARTPQPQALGVLGLTAIGLGAFAIRGATTLPVMPTLLPVLGTCALLAAGAASRGGAARVLSLRPVVWTGDLSYSWYLWHWPLIVFATALWPGAGWAAPVFAALSLVPAWLSYRYVENPIRFNRRITGRAVVALAAVCIVVPIGAVLGFERTAEALAANSTMKSYQRSQSRHADFLLGCERATPLGQRTTKTMNACTWRLPKPRGLVVLIGDSNAGHFSEVVVRATNRAGFDLAIATLSACPFVDLQVQKAPYSREACRRFYTGSLEALIRMRPSLVINANRPDVYIHDAASGLGSPAKGTISHAADAKAHLWYQGLASTLRNLNDAGIPVIVVHPVPLQAMPFGDCAVLRVLTQSCTGSVARSTVEAGRRPAVDAENRAVAAVPAAWTVDFINALCGLDRCNSTRGTTPLYRDQTHLSIDGALTLTNEFSRAILERARP